MRIGEYNELEIIRDSPHGLYLTDGMNDALLPANQCSREMHLGDRIRVFLYTDSEDRPIATTRHPLATVGQFAKLKVVETYDHGAFLDWGLDKDVYCPIREQIVPMQAGRWAFVRLYLDEISSRVVCTSRWKRFLTSDGREFKPGERVSIIVAERTPNFVTAIIDHRVRATLFADEWTEDLEVGDQREAFIKSVRDTDYKIALSLRPQGREAILGERERVLQLLKDNRGVLRLSDKSSPERIQEALGMSKGAFKKLIGALYKEGLIDIEPSLIRLRRRLGS